MEKYWMPAEADVSIRPGWFYHASQDAKVRSGQNLVDLYFKSVGRGASLLLNLPPDRRGTNSSYGRGLARRIPTNPRRDL